MNDVPAANDEPDERDRALRRLRRHVLVYAAVNGVLLLIDLLAPGQWWFLWPMFGWGVVVVAHWLYVRSVHIDEAWAQLRTEDIRQKAYDAGHIEEIEKRYERASGPSSLRLP